MPRKVRTSCSVGAMRVNMVLILLTMVSRLSGREQEPAMIEFTLEMLEKGKEFMPFGRAARLEALSGALRRIGKLPPERVGVDEFAPLISEQQNGLRQIQRREFWIDGGRDDHVGKRDLGILKARPFLAEQNATTKTGLLLPEDRRRRPIRRKHRLRKETAPRCGGGEKIQIRDGVRNRIIEGRRIDDLDGERSGGPRGLVRPPVARLHEPQLPQPEIRHGAGRRADVFAKLRLDKNNCWSRKSCGWDGHSGS